MNMMRGNPICASLKTETLSRHYQIGTHHAVLNLRTFPVPLSKDTFYSSSERDSPVTSGHLGDWFPSLGQLAAVPVSTSADGAGVAEARVGA